MSTLSAALGSAAAPYTLEHKGKTYKARLITQGVKTEYERWLQQEAMRSILPLQGLVDNDTFKELVRDVTEDVASRKFAFHGEFAQATMRKPGGATKLASLVFQCSEEEMVNIFFDQGAEANMILEAVLRESFPQREDAPVNPPEEGGVPN